MFVSALWWNGDLTVFLSAFNLIKTYVTLTRIFKSGLLERENEWILTEMCII